MDPQWSQKGKALLERVGVCFLATLRHANVQRAKCANFTAYPDEPAVELVLRLLVLLLLLPTVLFS